MGEAILAVLIPPARGPGGAAPARPGAGGQGFGAMVDGPAARPDGAERVVEEVAGDGGAATGSVADPPLVAPDRVIPTVPAAEMPAQLDDLAPIPASEVPSVPRPVTPLDASTALSSAAGSGEVPGVSPGAPRPGRGRAEPALWPHLTATPGLLRATEVQARPEGTTPASAVNRLEAHLVFSAVPAGEVLAAPADAAAAGAPSHPSRLPASGTHPATTAGVPPAAPMSAPRVPEDVAARRAGVSAIPTAPARPEPQKPLTALRPDVTRGPSLAEAAPPSARSTSGGATPAAGPASPPGAPFPQAVAPAAPPPASPTAPLPPAAAPSSPAPRPAAARGVTGVDPAAAARGLALGDRAETPAPSAPPLRPVRPALAEPDPGARPWMPEGPAEPLRVTAEGPGSVTAPMPRAETSEGATARRLAEGVAQTVAQSPALRATGAAEMTLAPEELGTLHLRVEGEGAGLRLVIEALRPETADLLRRHAEVLRQELRQEGLGALSVSIGGGEGRDRPEGERAGPWIPTAQDAAPDTSFAAAPAAPRPRGPAGGVDLRL